MSKISAGGKEKEVTFCDKKKKRIPSERAEMKEKNKLEKYGI